MRMATGRIVNIRIYATLKDLSVVCRLSARSLGGARQMDIFTANAVSVKSRS